mgnify:FL=1
MIDEKNQNGWNEYSKLVLKELERLNDNYESLREEMSALRNEVNKNETDSLKRWKNNVDEVFSPSQMKDLRQEVDALKSFKTTAVTIFAVIQFIMALVMALSKFLI